MSKSSYQPYFKESSFDRDNYYYTDDYNNEITMSKTTLKEGEPAISFKINNKQEVILDALEADELSDKLIKMLKSFK
jgi:hypothetical protein